MNAASFTRVREVISPSTLRSRWGAKKLEPIGLTFPQLLHDLFDTYRGRYLSCCAPIRRSACSRNHLSQKPGIMEQGQRMAQPRRRQYLQKFISFPLPSHLSSQRRLPVHVMPGILFDGESQLRRQTDRTEQTKRIVGKGGREHLLIVLFRNILLPFQRVDERLQIGQLQRHGIDGKIAQRQVRLDVYTAPMAQS